MGAFYRRTAYLKPFVDNWTRALVQAFAVWWKILGSSAIVCGRIWELYWGVIPHFSPNSMVDSNNPEEMEDFGKEVAGYSHNLELFPDDMSRTRTRILIKHKAATHISNSIGKAARETYNVLLQNAYNNLLVRERHRISRDALLRALGTRTNNTDFIKDILRQLTNTSIEWNILDFDTEQEWGVMPLLAEASLKSGMITYAFAPTMREQLYSPTRYARLNLTVQTNFKSKHSLALWELLLSYHWPNLKKVETPEIDLAKFRQLMGLDPDQYSQFSDLNRYVIKPAVEAMNDETDFVVEVIYRKEGRHTSHVKFKAVEVPALPSPAGV